MTEGSSIRCASPRAVVCPGVPIRSARAHIKRIMAKRLKESSGFTLLEGMIATAILSVGVLAVGSMQGIALRKNVDSTELSQAVNLASEMLERIQYNRRN